MSADAAVAMTERLRAGLKLAMRARSADETRVLRALLGAIDNAQAVPLDPARKPSDMAAFGDSSIEVPRRVLTPDDIAALLAHEAQDRETAAVELDALGIADRAETLRAEAAIVRRYGGAT
ncbi:MAG: hypothetical protein J7494_00715 [Sphingobium sp.]|nr:hypothetical protein [Sphingobium sp.]